MDDDLMLFVMQLINESESTEVVLTLGRIMGFAEGRESAEKACEATYARERQSFAIVEEIAKQLPTDEFAGVSYASAVSTLVQQRNEAWDMLRSLQNEGPLAMGEKSRGEGEQG